jgi:hypothetical protein
LHEIVGESSAPAIFGGGCASGPYRGVSISGAEYVWLAVLGRDTPAIGERTNCGAIAHNQIAATIAALLGEDYQAAFPKVGAPIRDVLPQN